MVHLLCQVTKTAKWAICMQRCNLKSPIFCILLIAQVEVHSCKTIYLIFLYCLLNCDENRHSWSQVRILHIIITIYIERVSSVLVVDCDLWTFSLQVTVAKCCRVKPKIHHVLYVKGYFPPSPCVDRKQVFMIHNNVRGWSCCASYYRVAKQAVIDVNESRIKTLTMVDTSWLAYF